MKNELQQQAINIIHSSKIEAAVSTVTIAAGVGMILNYLPKVLGCISILVGITLTLVLLRNAKVKGKLEAKKIQLEIDLLKEREAQRIQDRKDKGLPCRRNEDKTLT